MVEDTVIVQVWRSHRETGHELGFQTYQVPYLRRMSVLTMLNYIYEHLDPTLAYRNYTCGRGLCNSCRVKLNGKTIKGCNILVRAGDRLVLRPFNDRVIRDLATVIGA